MTPQDRLLATTAGATPYRSETPSARSLGGAISGALAPDWLSDEERAVLVAELQHQLQQRDLTPFHRAVRNAQQSCLRWLPSSPLPSLEEQAAQLVAASLWHAFRTVDFDEGRVEAWRAGGARLSVAFQALERPARGILSTRYQRGDAGLASTAAIYGMREHELVALHAAALRAIHLAL